MEEHAKTGFFKLHMSMETPQIKIQKLIWDQTSAETLMEKKLFGAIQLIQIWDGNIVIKLLKIAQKVYGVKKVQIIEEFKLLQDLESIVKHGMINHLMLIHTSQKNTEMENSLWISVEIQRVLKKLFGVTPLMLTREENYVIQSMKNKNLPVKNQLELILLLIEALNQLQKMEKCVKIGILKNLMNIKILTKINHSMTCIQTFVEILMVKNQFGAIQLIQKKDGITVMNLTEIMWKDFGVIWEVFIEDTRILQDLAYHAKDGMFKSHMIPIITLLTTHIVILIRIIVEIQIVLVIASGAIQLIHWLDGNIVVLFTILWLAMSKKKPHSNISLLKILVKAIEEVNQKQLVDLCVKIGIHNILMSIKTLHKSILKLT